MRALTRRGSHIPREINLLCHNSLILAYAAGRDRVEASMVRAAAADYETNARSTHLSRLGDRFYRLRSLPNLSRGRLLVAAVLGGAALGWPLAAYTRLAARPQSSKSHVAAATSVETPTNNSARHQVARADQGEVRQAAQSVTPAAVEAPAAPAQPQPSNPPSSNSSPLQTVVIGAGDNLSGIAEQYLGSNDPAAIRRLIAANPQISDTNLIHPGDIVRLPSEDN
jgi:hypothetical protein